jgi:hypothetical protein
MASDAVVITDAVSLALRERLLKLSSLLMLFFFFEGEIARDIASEI